MGKTGVVCEIEGLMRGGRWGHSMVQLPGNCRPKQRLIFNMNNHAKSARVDVQTNGQVTWHAGGRDHHIGRSDHRPGAVHVHDQWYKLEKRSFRGHAKGDIRIKVSFENYTEAQLAVMGDIRSSAFVGE